MNRILNIINEEIKTQLIETPDNIIVGNKQYWLHEDGVYPFAIDRNSVTVTIGHEGSYHADNYDDEGDELDDVNKYRFLGRIFSKPKVITFWDYPIKSIIFKIIKQLEDILSITIMNNGWRIEVFKNDAENDSNFIPVEEYLSSEMESTNVSDELRQQHLMNPMDSRKKKRPYGGGSNMTASDQANNLAWRMALRQESNNLNDLIYNELIELLSENIIKEYYDDDIMYDLFEKRDEIMRDTINGFMNSKKGDRQFWQLISFPRLKKIWEDAAKMNFVRDEKGLEMIKKQIITNLIKLDVNTEIMGHTQALPTDEIEDSGYSMEEFDNKMNDDDFSVDYFNDGSGQYRLSDYGLKPLWEIAQKLVRETNDIKKIMYIDQMLNVVHMRSDMANNFVQGGSEALSQLSGQYHEE